MCVDCIDVFANMIVIWVGFIPRLRLSNELVD